MEVKTMKNEKLFYETIDILVKAYLNGTLKNGDCMACAVGNIVAKKHYGHYGKIERKDHPNAGEWYDVILV